ncbi:hypothetical protein BsWGS_17712 [Bradybaena similaris]
MTLTLEHVQTTTPAYYGAEGSFRLRALRFIIYHNICVMSEISGLSQITARSCQFVVIDSQHFLLKTIFFSSQ